MKKRNLFLLVGIALLIISFISSISYCCEKTTADAWCQPSEEGISCNSSYQKEQGSCEMTLYCKTGTCIDREKGSCSASPKSVCERNGGLWDERIKEEVPDCDEACCFIAGQSFLATRTKCGKIASASGREMVFDDNITDELTCLRSANPNENGACVFIDSKGTQTCKMITKGECNKNYPEGLFHKGKLCSARDLNTNCAPKGGTICGEHDKVYFLDTCNNTANVYDNSKINNENYWTFIQEPDCSTEDNPASKNSASCGNCDYQLGSVCSKKKIGESVTYGNYICRDVDCHNYIGEGFNGADKYPKQGEIWCAEVPGIGIINSDENYTLSGGINVSLYNLPGSQYIKRSCMNGEVISTACDPFRNQVCIENDEGSLKYATCRTNNWYNCTIQTNQKDCENEGIGDCMWFEGFSILRNESGESLAVDERGIPTNASCIPKYAPGFEFWENGGDDLQCSFGVSSCVVTYKKDIFDIVGEFFTGEVDISKLPIEKKKEYCDKNCECLDDSWKQKSNSVCSTLGDCGVKVNYIGKEGYEKGDVIRFAGQGEIEE